MAYNLSIFKQKVGEVKTWLTHEYSGIRRGRATPILLDSVMVESYGSRMPLKNIATITSEDAKTLRLAPWDKANIKNIETAISSANLGVSTVPDEAGVRVIFPDLTTERRQILSKLVREKFEEAKISIRKERERLWGDIQDKERAGEMSEDDKFRLKDELQKMVDESSADFEKMTALKEEEIKQ